MFKDPYIFRIVQHQAKRYRNKYCPYDELISEGLLAVVEMQSKYEFVSYSLVDQAVKWRIYWYIRKDMRFRRGVMSHVEYTTPEDVLRGNELLKVVGNDVDMDVIDYMCKGYDIVEIGGELGVSKQRIHQRLQRIKKKWGEYEKG